MNIFRFFKHTICALTLVSSVLVFAIGESSILGYDPGPDPTTKVGQGYIEISNTVPNAVVIGRGINANAKGSAPRDKFRYPYGIMPWRGPTDENSVSVLVIGQDGTHIAEAAGRPFTGGTGGRVQNVLGYLGVRDSAMFINTFSYTIYGQYTDFGAPYINGDKVVFSPHLTPEGFLLAQDPNNPYVQWRNNFIDHIIDSNRDSLKLIMLIGGAASDTFATYIRSRAGEKSVPFRLSDTSFKKHQAILYGNARTVGNREFYFPADENGNDLLNKGRVDYKSTSVQADIKKKAQANIDDLIRVKAGEFDNGFLNKAQLGYDLRKMDVGGPVKLSLKGLKIRGNALKNDIRFISFRHPGSMSASLEKNFRDRLDDVKDFHDKDGWQYPSTDPDMSNLLAKQGGKSFDYNDKPPIPAKDFPLGKSKAVIVNQSLASRNGKNTIVIGGRDRMFFDSELKKFEEELADIKKAGKSSKKLESKIKRLKTGAEFAKADSRKALKGLPAEGTKTFEGTQPWNPAQTNDEFDRGPDAQGASTANTWTELFNSIPLLDVFEDKNGKKHKDLTAKYLEKIPSTDFHVSSHPFHGAFGFFRGNTVDPEVLIIADPSDNDLDDLYTARALTGDVGQKLHGLMSGLNVGNNYLVVKTLPFDMTSASDNDWAITLKRTYPWRQKVLNRAIGLKPKLILTIGKHAEKIVAEELNTKISSVHIGDGLRYSRRLILNIKKTNAFGKRRISLVSSPMSIPREHLPFPMQAWMGTSGSRVIRAVNQKAGRVYAIICPNWVIDASDNVAPMSVLKETNYVKSIKKLFDDLGFAEPGLATKRLAGWKEDPKKAANE